MSKYVKIITVILIACLIISIPFLLPENKPDEAIVSSGELSDMDEIDKAYEESAQTEVTEEKSLDEYEPKEETPYEENLVVDEPAKEEEKVENITKCSLTVSCKSVLENIDKLKKKKADIVPESGIFLVKDNIEFVQGESAFDVLLRVLDENNISIEYVNNPMFNSAYVKGIGNLNEFDCGGMSGWLYKINGEKQSVGSSQYILNNNDKIEFYYTCNYADDM